jgi:ABC-type polysaccharide/polyol phosphate export permease
MKEKIGSEGRTLFRFVFQGFRVQYFIRSMPDPMLTWNVILIHFGLFCLAWLLFMYRY